MRKFKKKQDQSNPIWTHAGQHSSISSGYVQGAQLVVLSSNGPFS